MADQKFELFLLSIVAIVGLVAITVIMRGGPSLNTDLALTTDNLAGGASFIGVAEEPTVKKGWPVTGVRGRQHLTVANLDQDKDMEIVAATGRDAVIVQEDGSTTTIIGNGLGFPESMVVGDVTGDKKNEIVGLARRQYIYIWDGDGNLLYDWQVPVSISLSTGEPVLADMDGDGDMEILLTAGSGRILVHQPDGELLPGWPQQVPGSYQKLAAGDIDGDGYGEIVADSYNTLRILKHDGTEMTTITLPYARSTQTAPVIGDLDGDGRKEILVGTSELVNTYRGMIHAYYADGSVVPGWPRPHGSTTTSEISLGDLDGDGNLEVVVGQQKMFAFHHDGTPLAGFPWAVYDYGNNRPSGVAAYQGILIANVDADPDPELIANVGTWIHAYNLDGSVVPGWPILNSVAGTAAAFDIDFDGLTEIVFARGNDATLHAYDTDGAFEWKEGVQWPMYAHDAQHSGEYKPILPGNLQYRLLE